MTLCGFVFLSIAFSVHGQYNTLTGTYLSDPFVTPGPPKVFASSYNFTYHLELHYDYASVSIPVDETNGFYCYISVRGRLDNETVWTAPCPPTRFTTPGCNINFTTDGNLKVVSGDGWLWNSGSVGKNVTSLEVEENGVLILADDRDRTVWSSSTITGIPDCIYPLPDAPNRAALLAFSPVVVVASLLSSAAISMFL